MKLKRIHGPTLKVGILSKNGKTKLIIKGHVEDKFAGMLNINVPGWTKKSSMHLAYIIIKFVFFFFNKILEESGISRCIETSQLGWAHRAPKPVAMHSFKRDDNENVQRKLKDSSSQKRKQGWLKESPSVKSNSRES